MQKPVQLYEVIAPVFLLFLALYSSTIMFDIETKNVLLLKLAVGALILGAYPAYRMLSLQSPRPFITFSSAQWSLIGFCIFTGIWMYFLVVFSRLHIFHITDFQSPLLRYGVFEILSFEFMATQLMLLLYVFGEEAYFRGFLYPYIKNYTNAHISAAVCTALFAFLHLIFLPSHILLFVVLSLFSTYLTETTGTIFYGFVAHASLDATAVVFITSSMMSSPIPLIETFIVLTTIILVWGYYTLVPGLNIHLKSPSIRRTRA